MPSVAKDRRDIFYRLGKERGYRARSAFKLLQVHERTGFLDGVLSCVDLCAAPGSWSQVLASLLTQNAQSRSDSLEHKAVVFPDYNQNSTHRKGWVEPPAPPLAAPYQRALREQGRLKNDATSLNAKVSPHNNCSVKNGSGNNGGLNDNVKNCGITTKDTSTNACVVAVDLLPMRPLANVYSFRGDITDRRVCDRIWQHFQHVSSSKFVDLVTFDGAVDAIRNHARDEYMQVNLLFVALNMALLLLRPGNAETGGKFIGKLFRGRLVRYVYAIFSQFFTHVSICKPKACRTSSFEGFIVATGFRGVHPNSQRSLCGRKGSITSIDLIHGLGPWSPLLQGIVRRHISVPYLSCGYLRDVKESEKKRSFALSCCEYPLDSDRSYPVLTDSVDIVSDTQGNIAGLLGQACSVRAVSLKTVDGLSQRQHTLTVEAVSSRAHKQTPGERHVSFVGVLHDMLSIANDTTMSIVF